MFSPAVFPRYVTIYVTGAFINEKALIVLLMLAVAGGLFAQISFGGSASSGLVVAIEDDVTFHVYNDPDQYASQYALKLDAGYTTQSGKAGLNGGFYYNAGGVDGGAVAWFKPLDILEARIGNIDDWWRAATPGSLGANNDFDNSGPGLLLLLDPIAGLNFGAGVYPSGGEFGDARYTAMVKYTSSGLFSAVANVNYIGSGNDGDGEVRAAAGVDVLALSGMGLTKLAVDVFARNITKLDTATNAAFRVGPRIHFSFGDFSAGVRANLYVPVQDAQELNVAASVWGQYPVTGAINVRLGVGYILNGSIPDTNGEAFDYKTDWRDLGGSDGAGRDYNTGVETSVVGVRPSLAIGIGGGTLDLGYGFETQLGDVSKTKSAIYTSYSIGF